MCGGGLGHHHKWRWQFQTTLGLPRINKAWAASKPRSCIKFHVLALNQNYKGLWKCRCIVSTSSSISWSSLVRIFLFPYLFFGYVLPYSQCFPICHCNFHHLSLCRVDVVSVVVRSCEVCLELWRHWQCPNVWSVPKASSWRCLVRLLLRWTVVREVV